MTHKTKSAATRQLLLVLALLVTGCASAPPLSPPVVQPPQKPPLPQEARQPPAPAQCLPTCSDAWKRLVESLLP